jgi:hypothetical protein
MNELKKAFTYDDVNYILKDYNITINDLNIKQIIIIKKILKDNLEKIINSITDEKINYILNRNNKKLFNSEYFLSNKFITDIDIEKVYGKYIHLNKPEDNIVP